MSSYDDRLLRTFFQFLAFFRVSYIEIYKEKMYDLLNERQTVTVDANGQLSNQGVPVENSEKTIEILFQGSKERKLSLNDTTKFSSRSHAIFRIVSQKVVPHRCCKYIFRFKLYLGFFFGFKFSLDNRIRKQS